MAVFFPRSSLLTSRHLLLQWSTTASGDVVQKGTPWSELDRFSASFLASPIMPPRQKGKGIVKSGAMSSKASPLPDRTPKEPEGPLTPLEKIQRELGKVGYKTPLTLLNERCSRLGWERCSVDVRSNQGGHTPAITLHRHVKKSKNSPIESCRLEPHPPLKCETVLEARHMGAVYALFRFSSSQPISLTLPPHFRPYWTELLLEKSSAPPHRAWEFSEDPFNARAQVTERQEKSAARSAAASSTGGSGASTPARNGGGGGGGGSVMLSGEWERAPEVRMAPALRELVEDTIRNQTAQYPDAILSATRDVTDGNANGNSPPAINIDAIALTRQLEGLGFRRAHVKNVVRVMDEAAKRIYDNGGANGGGGIDPLVLALTTLSPQEAAIEWLILHLPEDDLPTRFRPTASVADFVSSARAGSGSKTLVQTWLVEKLIKEIGFPRKAVEGVLRLSPGGEADDREWGEGEAVEALTRRMVGLEEGEWGVENVLERLRIGRGGMEVVVDVGMRDEKRREELEAVESVFDERYVPNPEKPEEHVTIAIPPLDPESATTDDLMIHILFPSDPISSPYPSATHPTSPPPFYLTSFSLPAYIRLHLQALVYRQFTDPDREDLRSTLESGEGGVVFAMVDFLSQEWEAIVENPPDVSQVTKYLVPKLPPPPKDATPTGPVGKKNAGRRGPSVRREPSREELESLKRRTEEWQARQEFEKVLKGRMGLPAWKSREEVLEALDRHRVLVVVGETGSGKTTQLPQFILDHEIASLRPCSILVTQPRRVSALGVAARVANERLEDVEKASGSVGYAIRGERRAGRDTRLLFLTTGVLLRRLSAGGDADLEGVTHVIVDEVHERSVDGDFLLLELRELLKRNSKIKIVLMSATINHLTFTTYFGNAPLLEIQGRTFPVADHYLEDIVSSLSYRPQGGSGGGGGGAGGKQKQSKEQQEAIRAEYESMGLTGGSIQLLDSIVKADRVEAGLVAAVVQHAVSKAEDKGGVLVFCPGVMEITQVITALRGMNLGPVEIMPLHAQLSSAEQKRVFNPTSTRKIVVATNIAETSITIDDITIVVDTGKVKETQYEAEKSMQMLVEVFTSRAASRQRKGRAGRTKPGTCYKVFTRRLEQNKMSPFPVPEILRTPLEALFLQVKAMREDEDVKLFLSRAIDPPSTSQMDAAWNTLVDLGAVEGEHATSRLTALGKHMSSIPVDLRLAKMLVLASIFKCLDPVLSITAILSSKPLFLSPMEKRQEAQKARAKFVTGNSDLLTDCRAYTEASSLPGYGAQRSFCEENFISSTSIRDITTLRTDFLSALSDLGFVPPFHGGGRGNSHPSLNVNSQNENLIKSIILGGLYPRIARVNLPKAKFEQMAQGSLMKDHIAKEIKLFDQTERVFLHPGSVLFGETRIPSGFVTYFAKNMTTKVFLRDATEVPLYALLLFGGKVTVNHFASGLMIGNGWVKLKAWTRIGVLVNQLRRLLDASLEAAFDDPTMQIGGNEEVISTMLALLARDGLAP